MDIINPYIHGGEALTFDGFGNRSRSFNGVDDYITAPDGSWLPRGAQTWACWVKYNSSGTYAFFNHNGSFPNRSIQIVIRTDNKIQFQVSADGTNREDFQSVSSLTQGEWYHIACVFNPFASTGQGRRIYINGVLDQNGSTNYTLLHDTNQDVGMGANGAGLFNLDGKLADCRIYDADIGDAGVSDLYNGTNVTTNLVGHWLTDEDNVLDNAGTNHGTNFGSTYSYDNPSPPVEFGSASRIFNGTSDYISLGNSIKFGDGTNDNPFSVSGWIKMDDANKFRILGDWNEISTINSTFVFTTNSSNKLILYLRDASNVAIRAREYNFDMTSYEGEWIHVSATYNGAGGTNADQGIRLYLNGSRVDDATLSTDTYVAMESTTNNVEIGSIQTNAGRDYSNGKIADVRIYDTDLTASQVLDIYNGTDVQTNLIGHWLTDNDDVEDKAGTNDGTNFGSAYSDDNPPMDLIPFGQKSRTFANDYINTNTGFQSVFQSSFSISTWVRFDDGIPSAAQAIFGNQSAVPTNRVLIFLDTAGALTFGYFSNGIQARAEIDQNFANGDTGWFHYTAVVEPTGITIYKDGLVQTLDATDDGDMSALTMGDYGTDIDCYIGARNYNGSTDLKMNGNIADFRIYDSALSASDVTKIYNRTDDKSNIHAWYLTNSDDVLDHAGTNDGTNNGSTYSTDSPS